MKIFFLKSSFHIKRMILYLQIKRNLIIQVKYLLYFCNPTNNTFYDYYNIIPKNVSKLFISLRYFSNRLITVHMGVFAFSISCLMSYVFILELFEGVSLYYHYYFY